MKPDAPVTLRVLDMTFGDLHTPDGVYAVVSGLVTVPAKSATSPYFSDRTRFAVHSDPLPAPAAE